MNAPVKPEDLQLLIVDDDMVDVKFWTRFLRERNLQHPIHHAENGEVALSMLREHVGGVGKPLLILLDINMPRMNGHEFLTELRNDPELQDHVVIVMSTSNDEKDIARSYQKNVAAYVVKPVVAPGIFSVTDFIELYLKNVRLPV